MKKKPSLYSRGYKAYCRLVKKKPIPAGQIDFDDTLRRARKDYQGPDKITICL